MNKIRNPKFETRNKFEILIPKFQNILFLLFEFWSFDIVSDFDIRISDLQWEG